MKYDSALVTTGSLHVLQVTDIPALLHAAAKPMHCFLPFPLGLFEPGEENSGGRKREGRKLLKKTTLL